MNQSEIMLNEGKSSHVPHYAPVFCIVLATMFNWNWDQTGIFRKLVLNESVGALDLTVIRYLGFVHLVTESGIHLYALIGVGMAFWKGIAWGSGLDVRRSWLAGCLTGLGLCMTAWGLTDWRAGMLRPFVSVTVRMIAQVFGFRFQWFGPLVIALLVDILVLGERSASGRLHYALAVAGGLWIWSQFHAQRFSHLKMAIVSWFATAGLDMWELGLISVLTPLWSLITIPFFAGICFPLIVLSKIGLFYSESVFHWMNSAMIFCLKLAFSFPGMAVISKERVLTACVLGFFVCFLGMRWRIGLVLVALLVSGFLPKSPFMIQKNVDQGDAFMMREGDSVTMVDTGDQHRVSDSNWMKFFFAHQVTQVDRVLFTHLDADHASGIKRLERILPIGECWIDSKHLISKASPCVYTPTREPSSTGSLRAATLSNGSTKKGNSVMTGVWIRSEQAEYLNLGDAEKKLEWRLFEKLKSNETPLRRRILKITHHGSRYSLSRELLEGYSPHEAWISVGPRNRYGHPSHRAMSLVADYGIPVRRTDIEGDLK